MRKILLLVFLLCSLFAQAQSTGSDHIESSGTVRFFSGALVTMASPIYVEGRYDNERATWTAFCEIRASGAITGPIATEATFQFEYSVATVDALTPHFLTTTNTERIQSCMLQAVKASLTTLNGAIFTIQ